MSRRGYEERIKESNHQAIKEAVSESPCMHCKALSICRSYYLPICLVICLSICCCLFVCASIEPSIYLSTSLPSCPCTYLCPKCRLDEHMDTDTNQRHLGSCGAVLCRVWFLLCESPICTLTAASHISCSQQRIIDFLRSIFDHFSGASWRHGPNT